MSYFSLSPVEFWDETRTIDNIKISALQELLNASRATDAFKSALTNFLKTPTANANIRYQVGTPAVKIVRTIMKLLEEFPLLPIESVSIKANSGCSTFAGEIHVEPENKKFKFLWDCQWRALENDVKNNWGMPDQIKAAQDFGYQCFKLFEEVK
ncbi:MAG: hypothetical protein DWQ05_04340 [Calditrichaeota bacterium]|nr:MAG: hypothetical protein DWQ05_04340 [Calditrichota bacterium]